ncbi:cell division protein FtsQ [Marinibactrum halimedae]|uniref:Cell division protein FtsQ n=2 Tax=Marinibactrum halimedae TaxID=1444977 RepID=A0AA37T2D9_9GAMM|nr:cell division protein FtsQ [Marinibactrum halimedae]
MGVVSIVLTVAAVFSVSGWIILEKARYFFERPVSSIAIEGSFDYASQVEIQQLLEPLVDRSFFSLDLMSIKEALESNPWVSEVSLYRRWPDQLAVQVVEETPIARWGKTGYLNSRGERKEVDTNRSLAHLPLLHGPEGSALEVAYLYQQMVAILRPINLLVAELVLSDDRAWRLRTHNDLVIKIGRERPIEKMERFLLIYQQVLDEKKENIAVIDVRYDNGVAVQWREQTVNTLLTQSNVNPE